MNIGLFMGHPAHFHMLKHTAENLKRDGHRVCVVIKKKDILETLCQDSRQEYFKIREGRSGSKFGLIKSVLGMEYHMWQFIRRNKIDLLIGSTLSFTAAKINCIPVIAMGEDDADVVPNYAKLVYPFASVVLTPDSCNNGHWETKSSKYPGYHELAYLHPNHFQPNPEIVRSYGIPVSPLHHSINSSLQPETAEPYFILRFASLNAHHDDGIKGINTEVAQRLIDILSPHGRIYITSERPLEPQFEQYRIKINPLDMHHVMAFASLYIGDSQTMAAEAGVLGVPFVRFNDFVGRIGYLRELEDIYHLGFGVHASPILMENKNIKNSDKNNENSLEDNQKKVIENAESLVTDSNSTSIDQHSACEQAPRQTTAQSCSTDTDAQSLSNDSAQKIASLSKNDKNVIYRLDGTVQPSGVEALIETVERLVGMDAEERRRVFAERRKMMLSDKIDCAKFLTYFIEGYPDTVEEVRGADKSFWERFK